LIPSLRRASAAFTRHPYPFVWSSFMYAVMQVLFAFAAAGVFLLYFLLASVLGIGTGVSDIPTVIAAMIVLLVFLFFSCGLNAGLISAYAAAMEGRKTTVADFFKYSLQKSPPMFAIMAVRDAITLVAASPGIALFYFLKDTPFVDMISMLYVLLVVFIMHLLFTPVFVSTGAFGSGLITSLRNGAGLLRRKHVYALGLYVVFAIVWFFNFIPLVQLFTLFAAYPIVYSAFIAMFQGGPVRTMR